MGYKLVKNLLLCLLFGTVLSVPCAEFEALSGCSTSCNAGSDEVSDRGYCEAKNKKCCRTNCAGPDTFCIADQKSCEDVGEGFDEVDGTCPNDDEFRCCAPRGVPPAAPPPAPYPAPPPVYETTPAPIAPVYETTTAAPPPPAPETTQAPAPAPTAAPPPPAEQTPKPEEPEPVAPTQPPQEPATPPPQPDADAQDNQQPPIKESRKGKKAKKAKKAKKKMHEKKIEESKERESWKEGKKEE